MPDNAVRTDDYGQFNEMETASRESQGGNLRDLRAACEFRMRRGGRGANSANERGKQRPYIMLLAYAYTPPKHSPKKSRFLPTRTSRRRAKAQEGRHLESLQSALHVRGLRCLASNTGPRCCPSTDFIPGHQARKPRTHTTHAGLQSTHHQS